MEKCKTRSRLSDLSLNNKFIFNFDWISNYRTPLMGIAILGVMLAHIASVGVLPKWFTVPQGLFSRLLFTEGFFLLSGFGLYFSFTKCPDVKEFYKKRFMRLYIPFLIITLPFFIYCLFAGISDFTEFMLNITALRYYQGELLMWYISMSILLYALFPLFYMFIFKSDKPLSRSVILVILAILFSILMEVAFPVYYGNVRIGFDKVPIFIIGMYMGYLALSKRQVGGKLLIYCALATALLWAFKGDSALLTAYSEMSIRILCLLCLCIFFEHLKYKRTIIAVLSWFGFYSLELYILHMMFQSLLFHTMPHAYQYSWIMAVVLAIILCQPVHLIIKKIINFSKQLSIRRKY